MGDHRDRSIWGNKRSVRGDVSQHDVGEWFEYPPPNEKRCDGGGQECDVYSVSGNSDPDSNESADSGADRGAASPESTPAR